MKRSSASNPPAKALTMSKSLTEGQLAMLHRCALAECCTSPNDDAIARIRGHQRKAVVHRAIKTLEGLGFVEWRGGYRLTDDGLEMWEAKHPGASGWTSRVREKRSARLGGAK